ncbi:MAG: mycothiol synthase [Candidatus Nanopelagicales bacterium]|nr:mycothiol synthase [Candidatus Nanopelagicales bacterium]
MTTGGTDRIDVVSKRRLSRGQARAALLLAALEEDRCGRQVLPEHVLDPLGDRSETTDRPIVRHLLCRSEDRLVGYAHLTDSNGHAALHLTAMASCPAAADLLVSEAAARTANLELWAQGNDSAAGLLAKRLELTPSRELLIMIRPLPAGAGPQAPAPIRIRPFDPARDTQSWLELNSLAFAQLPDQGGWTTEDLRSRLDADWFDPGGFLVAEDPTGLVGFHWTKVDPHVRVDHHVSGEVFVLGVKPQWRGSGVAEALLSAGLKQVEDNGLTRAHLFVDTGNPRAIRFYQRAGFEVFDRDCSFQLPPG